MVHSAILFSDSLRFDPDLSSLLLQFCKQVVDGLVCLAGKSFVHRDIAARNILLEAQLQGGKERGRGKHAHMVAQLPCSMCSCTCITRELVRMERLC